MEVHLRFFEPFNGFIYAENYYDSSVCRWYGNTTKYLNLTIPIEEKTNDSCGATIDMANGKVTAILVVSPLRGVLVSDIAQLQVSCLFTVKDFTLTFPRVRVMSVKTEADMITGMAAKPTLFMQILEEHGINGVVISQANVGQRLTLDVVLENSAIYDFNIYACIAHDGSRSPDASLQIIDANGCGVKLARAIDEAVYNTTVNGAKHIYIHMYGFQFTSSDYVHFECQARTCVHLCPKKQCSTNQKSNDVETNKYTDMRRRRNINSDDLTNLTLHAILQMKPQSLETAKLHGPRPSHTQIGSIAIIPVTAALTLLAIAILYVVYLNKKKRSINVSEYRSETSYADSSLYNQPTRSFIYL